MFGKNKFVFILFCFLILISISSVCASDVNETSDDSGTFDELYGDIQSLHPGDTYNFNKDYVFTEDMNTTDFEHLAIVMNTQGIYNELDYKLYKALKTNTTEKFKEGYRWDYHETEKIPVPNSSINGAYTSIGEKIYNERVIVISCDNVIINGNGHTIDAGGILPWKPNRSSEDFSGNTGTIFKVTGNNVIITNLTFINSKPYNVCDNPLTDSICIGGDSGLEDAVLYDAKYVPSPVCWFGDNGTISDCTFSNNKAATGGAINWIGNNGTIKNVQFINNTARIVGGALYIIGSNTIIDNCTFTNSNGMLGENIYYDPSSKGNKIFYITTDSTVPFIDGAITNIPVRALENYYLVKIINDYYDLVKLMYVSITLGGEIKSDTGRYDLNSYYNNQTKQFVFTFSYYGFWLENVNCSFTKLFTINCNCDNGNFHNLFYLRNNIVYSEISFIINKAISDAKDYEDSTNLKFDSMVKGYLDFMHVGCGSITTILNLKFKENLYINSNTLFNASGFDIVNFEGNGATIDGGAGKKDEYHWISLNDKSSEYIASDLTVKHFNSAIVNYGGYCQLNNVSLVENKMDYAIDRDWGGAICNTGVLICEYCSFIDNYAKNGGAIFNQGIIYIDNTGFRGNYAYGEGDHICIGDGGKAFINGIESTRKNPYGPVHFAKSLSLNSVDLITAGGVAVSFAVGFLVGFFTSSPVAGIAAGSAVGTALGIGASIYINNHNFDLNHDRVYVYVAVMTYTISAGICGGFMGGVLGSAFEPAVNVQEEINTKDNIQIKESEPFNVKKNPDISQLNAEEKAKLNQHLAQYNIEIDFDNEVAFLKNNERTPCSKLELKINYLEVDNTLQRSITSITIIFEENNVVTKYCLHYNSDMTLNMGFKYVNERFDSILEQEEY